MLGQNLGKFYKVVLKILSGNEMMTDGHNDRQNDGMTDNLNHIYPTFPDVTSCDISRMCIRLVQKL